jgi:Fe2+ or Zn2+ uptake regulation protein
MIAPRTTISQDLRTALLQLLAPGRAITTTELRTRLADEGFPDLTQETVYRHLDTLARAGLTRRISHPGRRRIFWVRDHTPVSALHGRDHK